MSNYNSPKIHFSSHFDKTLCGIKITKKKGVFSPKQALVARQVTCKKCKAILNSIK